MINITIVRHGETDWNARGILQGKKDIFLNRVGRQQAQECRKSLIDYNYDMIITSSLRRAKETARIIHHKPSAQFLEMGHFTERHFGLGEGLSLEERAKQYPDSKYPQQESQKSFNERIVAGLDYIVENFDHSEIILVTHGAVINELLATLSNGTLKPGKIGLINGSISKIKYEDETWSIVSYNDYSHLSDYSEIGKI